MRIAKSVRLVLAALVAAAVAFGGLVVLGWTIDETRFDRPDERFDRLAARVESTPGVSIEATQRWVEAPTFSDPSSWIQATVDEAHLAELLSIACDTDYPDGVDWSLLVRTGNGSTVSVYAGPTAGDTPCADFGFDAAGVVGEVGRSLPGMALQASVWDNGRFALSVTDEESDTLSSLLPLVDAAEDVRDSAGLEAERSVAINTAALDVVIPAGEHDGYLALLTDLAGERGVTSFWAGGGQADGVDRVQLVAPDSEHAGIERAIRASGLGIADYPVRFLPQTAE